ncbi:hypothetical protein N9250_01670 [bacterium]|nr:hypothetical protein [Rubripirellula sp.]MDA7873724.1 hypothetical protein [Rhodopirellula sp.]MDB4540374.1 hypothetical protein [bacterium]
MSGFCLLKESNGKNQSKSDGAAKLHWVNQWLLRVLVFVGRVFFAGLLGMFQWWNIRTLAEIF